MKNIVTIALLLAMAGNAAAAGFRLTNQDAKATGMGGAFTAVADDASAAWYNPAALVDLEGTNVAFGSVMETPSMEHTNTNGTIDRIDYKVHVPPHFYATRKLGTKWAMGVAMNVPFGLSSNWSETTANTREVATDSALTAIGTNLNGAYKLSDKLSVGAGVSQFQVSAVMNKMHPVTATNELKLGGDGTGMGYNLAALYKHSKWQFGANYRSAAKIKIEGDSTNVTVTPVKTEITLPDLFQIGAAYKYSDNLVFSAEADYTNWTTYRNIHIKKQADNATVANDHKNWKSVWAFRLGGEYKLNDAWKIRAGGFYDMNPVSERYFETRIPDSDRVAVSVGAGYTKGSVTVDVSYMYLKFMERSVNNSVQDNGAFVDATALNGNYNASAMLPAITIGYKF